MIEVGDNHSPKNNPDTKTDTKNENVANCETLDFLWMHEKGYCRKMSIVISGESGLLRLFYSELFDASMALQYLFKSRDGGILQFLGNRLFDLSQSDLDFFLPQLLVLYLYTEEPTRNAIHPYLVKRWVIIKFLILLVNKKSKYCPNFIFTVLASKRKSKRNFFPRNEFCDFDI